MDLATDDQNKNILNVVTPLIIELDSGVVGSLLMALNETNTDEQKPEMILDNSLDEYTTLLINESKFDLKLFRNEYEIILNGLQKYNCNVNENDLFLL